MKQAEAKKRESIIEAREEIHKSRNELEREIKDRRSEMTKQERRLQQREESLERKHDAAEKKEEHTENTPAVPAVSINPALTAALEAAGITGERAEFLQSQLDRYREEKNVKQLVYRALVKKYGQKSGTEIYNTAKKIQI